jgi:hypothetical protein
MTYEEVRAVIHGFVSCNGSTSAGRVQLYRSINALTDTVMSLNLTKAEFAARWAQLFGVPVTTIDPHRDPSKSPTISSINAGNNVASVTFITTGTNNEANPQTDGPASNDKTNNGPKPPLLIDRGLCRRAGTGLGHCALVQGRGPGTRFRTLRRSCATLRCPRLSPLSDVALDLGAVGWIDLGITLQAQIVLRNRSAVVAEFAIGSTNIAQQSRQWLQLVGIL